MRKRYGAQNVYDIIKRRIATKYRQKINTFILPKVIFAAVILTKATCKNMKEVRIWALSTDTKGKTWKVTQCSIKNTVLIQYVLVLMVHASVETSRAPIWHYLQFAARIQYTRGITNGSCSIVTKCFFYTRHAMFAHCVYILIRYLVCVKACLFLR